MFLAIIIWRSFRSLSVVLTRFGGLLCKVETHPVLSESVTCKLFSPGFLLISFSFGSPSGIGASPSVTAPDKKYKVLKTKL